MQPASIGRLLFTHMLFVKPLYSFFYMQGLKKVAGFVSSISFNLNQF